MKELRTGGSRGVSRLLLPISVAALLLLTFGCDLLDQGLSGAAESTASSEQERPGSGAASSGAGRGGGGRPGGPPQSTAVAEDGSRSRTIQVAGRLRPRVRISHDLPVSGIVREVLVEPGERVQRGSVLFTVERDEVGQTFRPVPVEARISGVVSQVDIQTEEELGQGDSGVTVVSAEDFILEARISDKDATNVVVGQRVVGLTSSGAAVNGRLAVRGQEPDYQTGLFTLTFRFDQAEFASIGTFLSVELPTREVRGIFVPRDSVDRRYGRYFLWVVDEEQQTLTRREVTLGEAVGDEILVDGITAGERYIVTLTGREREGAPAPASSGESSGPGREG